MASYDDDESPEASPRPPPISGSTPRPSGERSPLLSPFPGGPRSPGPEPRPTWDKVLAYLSYPIHMLYYLPLLLSSSSSSIGVQAIL
jgi:hypothetical protein